MAYSRVSRVEEKKTKKQLMLVIIGIVALILVAFTVGIPLIVGTSVLLGNLKSGQTPDTLDKTPPFPPILSPVVSATNSASLKIEGYGEPSTTLKIMVNDEEAKKTLLDTGGSFSFTDIKLSAGKNTISATLTDEAGNESPPAPQLQVEYKKGAPKLEISEPTENQEFKGSQQEITVKGTTDPGNDVRINDRFVTVHDDGSFSFNFKLGDGENTLMVVARDSAGNETKLERRVTYSP